jgi:hypothetical protein
MNEIEPPDWVPETLKEALPRGALWPLDSRSGKHVILGLGVARLSTGPLQRRHYYTAGRASAALGRLPLRSGIWLLAAHGLEPAEAWPPIAWAALVRHEPTLPQPAMSIDLAPLSVLIDTGYRLPIAPQSVTAWVSYVRDSAATG